MNNQKQVEREVIGGDVHVISFVLIEGEVQPTAEESKWGDLPYWGTLGYRGTCVVLNPTATAAEVANALAAFLNRHEGVGFYMKPMTSSQIKLQARTTYRWESIWSSRRKATIDVREFYITRRA